MLPERLEAEPSINNNNEQIEEEIQATLAAQLLNINQIVIQAKSTCKKINFALNCSLLYLIMQSFAVIYNLYNPYDYCNNSIGKRYLWVRLIQYSFHIYSIAMIRNQNQKTINLLTLNDNTPTYLIRVYLLIVRNSSDQLDVWADLIKQNQKLYRINESLYVIIFIVGNIFYFSGATQLPIWLMIFQLFFGWILVGILGIFISLFCLLLPIVIAASIYDQRQQRLRRNAHLQTLQERVQLYSTLSTKSEQPCFICLQEYADDDLIIQLGCNPLHIFHAECLTPWAQTRDQCPVCRAQLQ